MVIGHNQSLLNIRIPLDEGQNQMKLWKLNKLVREINVSPGTLGCLRPLPAFLLLRCCPPVHVHCVEYLCYGKVPPVQCGYHVSSCPFHWICLSMMQSKKCVLWFLEATRTLMITGFAKRAPILHCFQDSETLIIFSCPSSSIPVSPTHLLLAFKWGGEPVYSIPTSIDWFIHSWS